MWIGPFTLRALFFDSVNVSLCMSVKPVSRWAMHAGSSTAWSMASSRTDRCPVTRPLEVEMTPSTPSSARPELENMFPGPSLWTWNQLLSVLRLFESPKTLFNAQMEQKMWNLLKRSCSVFWLFVPFFFFRWDPERNLPAAVPPRTADHREGRCCQQLRPRSLHRRQGDHWPGSWQDS